MQCKFRIILYFIYFLFLVSYSFSFILKENILALKSSLCIRGRMRVGRSSVKRQQGDEKPQKSEQHNVYFHYILNYKCVLSFARNASPYLLK